ncbi:T9SS type A sorting domain-containing protein [Flammeovirga aprica]|uniref:T9SS type A sorting domain-containing protein n=1 Tax=Flammeovirga aprica JL-4 TaxID=694437 RepID=A0A7X9X9F4_9BACT|nr:T9SS type A sorting domain-containing protein [Flammeovirga aprica]NME68801.1 T9SS type A sorting domain-containing protein [Flammeovirga aprica JL-4]
MFRIININCYNKYRKVFITLFLIVLPFIDLQAQNDIPSDGLELWLKADQISASDYTNVSGDLRLDKWVDQSGNGYYVNNDNNEDGIVYQTNQINGLPAVLFPSTGHEGLILKDASDNTVELLLENYEVFIVLKANETTGNVGFYAGGNATRALYGKWNSAQFYFRGPDSNLANTDNASWPISDSWGLISFQRNTSNETSYTSNAGLLTNLPNNTSNTNTHKFGSVGGANQSTTLGWDGYIAEVIVYNKTSGGGTTLDPVTRLRVNDYLTSKYGFTHAEFSDTDEIFNNNTTPNQNIVVYGNDGGVYAPDRGNPSTSIEIAVSNTSDGDYVIMGETNEGGLTFDFAPDNSRIWSKKFYLEKKGALDLTVNFDVQSFEGKPNDYNTGSGPERTVADYSLVYSADNGSTYTVVAGPTATFVGSDIVSFTLTDAQFATNGNGFYTLASTAPTAFYTKSTGNWTDTDIWTKNPSGFADGTNTYPSSTDDVFILSGGVITLNTNDIAAGIVEVNQGGTLIVGSTTNHNFSGVNGKGTIKLDADNFPSPANATAVGGFLTKDGGTVEFNGSSITLSNSYAYHNVNIDLDNASDELIIATDLTISDSLTLTRGKITLGTSNASNQAVNINVAGNTRVRPNASLGVGTDDVIHNIILKGSLINAGQIALTNRADIKDTFTFGSAAYLTELETYFANDLSGEYAILTFDADQKDQNLICNGETILYQIVVDKGTSDTYNLNISADIAGRFEMYGYNTHGNSNTGGTDGSMTTSNGMFVMKYGTIHFGQNIYVPSYANTTGNFDLGFGCRLWVDEGADINFGPVNALTVYGNVLVTGGRLNIGLNSDGTSNGKQNSITLREKGYFVQSGGQVFLNQVKTSVLGVDHQGSVTMSGGEMTVYGHVPGSDVAAFSLPYKTNSFNMSGGTITIHNEDSELQYLTKFAMGDGFYNVTGGEIIFDINTDRDAEFISSIPFYNLTVTTDYPLRNVSLSNGIGSFGDPIPTDGDLTILNHLVIEENSNLQIGDYDLTISGDLTLYDEAKLNVGASNALKFNGDGTTHYIDIRDTDEAYSINNLILDLPNASDVFKVRDFSGNSGVGATRLKVLSSLSLTQGTFDYSNYVVEVEGDLSFKGRIGESDALGHLLINGTAGTAQKIISSYDLPDAQIADTTGVGITHLWLNNANGVELSNVIYASKLTWQQGVIKANEYGVVVGAQGIKDQSGNPINNFSDNITNKRMLVGAGNYTDGGLTYLITANGSYYYPLASDFDTPVADSYKYTPATITVSDKPTADGYLQLATNNGSVATLTTDGTEDEIINYWWKTTNYGYSADIPNIAGVFKYHSEDLDAANDDEANFVPARVQIEVSNKQRETLGTTSDVDTDGDDATETDFTITTSAVPAYNSLFTAGAASKFTGELTIYYSFWGTAEDNMNAETVSVSRDANWNDSPRWTTNPDWKNTGNPFDKQGTPGAGDIIIVGHGQYGNPSETRGHRVVITSAQSAAVIRFDSDEGASLEKADLARVRLSSGSLTVDVVENIGSLRIHKGTTLNSQDLNDFLSEARSEIMIQSNNSDMEIPEFPKYPSVRLWGGGSFDNEFTFASGVAQPVEFKSLMVDGATLILDKTINVENNINVGGFREAAIEINSSSAITVTTDNLNLENTISSNSSASNKFLVTGTDDVEHKLIVNGDITIPEINGGESNAGGIEFSLLKSTTENRVTLELQGTGSGVFDNFYTDDVTNTLTPDLYKIVMNKGDNQDSTFTFKTNFTLPSVTTEELITLSNGTLVLDNADIDITPYAVAGSDWVMSSNSGLYLKQGTVKVIGDDANFLLGGKLTVAGGNFEIANAGQENSIIYATSGEIELSSGSISVGSELRRDLAANDASVTYTQSGGIFNAGLVGNPNSATRGTFEVVGSAATFDFSGGDINVYSGKITLDAASSSVNENAVIKLGNTIAESIDAVFENTIGKLELLSQVTVETLVNDINMIGDLTLANPSTLNLNSFNLNIAGDITNGGTIDASTSTITFNSTDDQTIGGSNAITAQNLIVDTDGATVTMGNAITASEDLTINTGTLSDNGQVVNVGGVLSVSGTHTTTGVGRIKMNGTSSQDMNITGSLGRLEIDNSTGINLTNSLNLVADEIVFTNGVLNIDQFTLNLGIDVVLTPTTAFNSDNMIQLSGSSNAQGVKIKLPATEIASEKLLPIGYSGIYAPVGIVGDYNEAELVIKPINTRHTVAENQGDNNEALNQYWRFEFSKTDGAVAGDRYVSLYYDDTNINGTESDYIGIIINDDAIIQKNVQKAIDLANNKIEINLNTGLVTGDYFAGDELSTPDDIIRYRLATGVTDAVLNDVSSGKWEISKNNGASYTALELESSPTLSAGTILEVPSGTNLTTTTDGTLGFRTYYKAIVDGTLVINVDDRQINFDAVEGAGTVKFFVNEAKVGQMPNADWEPFYTAGGGIIVEGDASSPVLNLNAPVNNSKLTIGSLSLIGTGTGQEWEIPSGNGLNISSGELSISNVDFDLSTSSNVNDINIINNGTLTINSLTTVAGDVNVDVGDTNDGNASTLNIASSSFIVKGNLVIDTDGKLIVSNANLDAENDITFNSGSSFSFSTGATLAVGGNFTDNGSDNTSTFTGSTLSFNGASGNQTFTGSFTSAKAIDNLQINKASGEVILSGSNTKEVSNLTLNSVLNNSGNDDGSLLILGNSIAGDSFVLGPLSKKMDVNDSFNFPVGGGGLIRTLTVIYTENVLGASEKCWTVEYGELLQPVEPENIDETTGIANVSSEYQWRVTDIDEGGDPTAKQSKAEIFAYYGGLGKNPNYILAIWNDLDLISSKWRKAGDPLHNTETYFETEDVSFSEKFLAIASIDETTDLPVELIYFNASAEESQVKLDWATASELNNDQFEIQRSVDGKNWSSIGMKEGAGNSNVRLDYEFFDANPIMNEIVYYRLIQTDFDGTETVFDPVQVYLEGAEGVADMSVYPNPTQGENLNILLKSWKGDVEIGLFNALGYKVLDDNWTYGDSQLKLLTLNHLPRGVYLLRLKSGKTIKSKRIIVE